MRTHGHFHKLTHTLRSSSCVLAVRSALCAHDPRLVAARLVELSGASESEQCPFVQIAKVSTATHLLRFVDDHLAAVAELHRPPRIASRQCCAWNILCLGDARFPWRLHVCVL